MSPNSAVVAPRRSALRASTRALRFLVVGLAVVWSLLLLAWLTLHWGILPHIDDWRPNIEAAASRALGVPVRIGRIQVRSGGWIPAAELHEVVLHDLEGREALRLPRVAAALSVTALLAFELRFEQLLIEGAQLAIRRDARGRIHVAGLEVGQAGGGDDHSVADWFFRQHEFVIRGGTLSWFDELRRSPVLELTDAVVVVRNGLLHHDLRIDATPQAAWGERFSLRARLSQPLMARAGDWQQWRGTVHADLPHVDVALLRQYVDLPFELRQGRGALRAWLEVADGQPGSATVDLALRDVALRLATQVAPIEFEFLRTRLDGERGDRHARVAARRLAFATADGLLWPDSEIEASWRTAPASAAAGGDATPEIVAGEFSADRLDVALLASLASRVPLSEGVRKMLVDLAPRGTVHGLVARWDGPLDAPRQYQVQARMKGLSITAAPAVDGVGRPGWFNADVDLRASELGGDARLTLADGALEFPGVFDRPVVPLRRFDAQLTWRIGATRPNGRPIELLIKEARFDNDDASGELALRWRTGDGAGFGRAGRFPGVLDLQGKLASGQATSVARYLPRGLPKTVRDYVQHAVQAGKMQAATFKVKGDLWDFPYYGAKGPQDGEFRIAGQITDLTLAYVPSHPGDGDEPARQSPWPVITRAEGELIFERSSMSIRNAQGRIFGVDLRGVQGGVRDFTNQATLELDGQARGPLADMVRYVNTTPVGEWIDGALSQTAAQGVADLRLALHLPLAQLPQSSVKGSVQLSGNDIRLRPDTPSLAAARGRVEFSQRGLQIVGGAARVLGGEATVDGGTQPDGHLRFNVQGVASAEGLRRLSELGTPARIGQVLQGQTPYRLQLGFVKGRSEFTLTSPMTGMAINLPPPLNKPADQSLALKVQSTLQADSLVGGSTPRDQLRVELGPVVQALYQRDLGGDSPRILRSAVGINTPAPAPVAGGQVQAEFASLNVDAWRTALAKLWPAAAGDGGDAGFVPRSIALRAQEMVAGSRRLTHVNLDLGRTTRDDNEIWRAQLTADQLAGLIEYREPRSAQGAGRVYARLSRLSLPPAEAEGVERLLDQAPASVPGLDIVIDDFELRGKHLGRLEVEAVNRGVATGGVAREWRLNRLVLRTPEATLNASGLWAALGSGAARRRMALDFQLELADSGAYLDRLGYGKTLRGGKGRLQGQLAWSGSPLGWDTKSLDGNINLSLDAGQFLRADAGAGRLLGVLSLQALPRRLLLDFRDVFQEGFAFDNVGGDFRLSAGVLQTNNLRMRGVQAAVLMEGQADIGQETQDLRVFVVPEINAGTASLAFAAINPALGLGTFVAQWLLRRPLIAANTREFHITGKWDDPKMDRIERQPGDAVPALDGPAAAASAPPQRP